MMIVTTGNRIDTARKIRMGRYPCGMTPLYHADATRFRLPPLLFEAQTRAAQINLVARPQPLPARPALGHLNRSPAAKDARPILAGIVADPILARLTIQPHVRVPARNGRISLVGAFLEHDVVP